MLSAALEEISFFVFSRHVSFFLLSSLSETYSKKSELFSIIAERNGLETFSALPSIQLVKDRNLSLR